MTRVTVSFVQKLLSGKMSKNAKKRKGKKKKKKIKNPPTHTPGNKPQNYHNSA